MPLPSDDCTQRIVDVNHDTGEHILKKLLDRQSGRISERIPFIERYEKGDASLHLHNRVRIIGMNYGWEFCAVIKGYNRGTTHPATTDHIYSIGGSGTGQCKTTVFVDIRESDQKLKPTVRDSDAVIRLHSLNDCVRFFGNPRKVLKYTVRERRLLSRLQGSPGREHAVLLPLGGQGNAVPIELDEIESQMIQGGSKLINDLACENSDVFVRLREIECRFAIRLEPEQESIAQITSSISSNAIFESFEMLRCPDDFGP